MSLIRKCVSGNGPQRTIAVLDGGGVRGLFGLEIFRLLSHAQSQPISVLFDLIVGVSAGALIGAVVALGMLDDPHTSDATCQSLCAKMPEFFGRKQRGWPLFRSKYDGSNKSATLHNVLGERKFGDVRTRLVIMCSLCSGEPIPFCSWDPQYRDMPLALLLDASTAAHTFYPPVLVGNRYFTDGGIRANKPLVHALLLAAELFDQGQYRFLSVGTHCKKAQDLPIRSVAAMGILGWFRFGIVNAMLGLHDNTAEQLLQFLFLDGFLRLECQCDDVQLDATSINSHKQLILSAGVIWNREKDNILRFLSRSLESIASHENLELEEIKHD